MTEAVGETWYRPAGDSPPANVIVRVIWDGREPFQAARTVHPESRRRCWVTRDGSRPVFLPLLDRRPVDPARPWAGWHTLQQPQPDFWQPLRPELWKAPLPEPVLLDVDVAGQRLWSARQSFGAVDDAEAADLAREMEAARAHANCSGEGLAEGEGEPPEKQWWCDPFAITYSPPEAITERECEGRLMRAFMTERWVRVEGPADRTFAGVLTGLVRTLPLSADELAASDCAPAPREPSGRDRDDMLVALSWLAALDARGAPKTLRGGLAVLRLRAVEPALSWRRIGNAVHRSHTDARRLYAAALAEVTRAANGEATEGGTAAAHRLETLRSDNREAKRRW